MLLPPTQNEKNYKPTTYRLHATPTKPKPKAKTKNDTNTDMLHVTYQPQPCPQETR